MRLKVTFISSRSIRTRRFLLFFAHLTGEAVSDEHDSSRDQANPGVMNNMGSTQFVAAIRA
jgi:hypothetical protein